MKCLEDLVGKVRRLACYHTDGGLKVVIDAYEHTFDGRSRTPLCQAIAIATKAWLEEERGVEIRIAGELTELDTWLKLPKARLNVEFKDSLFVAKLWQADKLMAAVSINNLEAAIATIEDLAHKLLVW